MNRNELPKLIIEIQSGNQDAFAQLYHEFYTSFFYMALKLTNNEADAHDAVQDTFISIQKNINSLKNADVAIVWMKQILFNRCKNMFRKNRGIYMDEGALAAMDLADEHEDSIPYEVIRKQSDREVVLGLLANIPYIYRVVLILKYYDDAKMSEIAKVLDIPEGTVKSRLRTGKKLLKEQINLYEEHTNEKVPFHFIPVGLCLFMEFKRDAEKGTTRKEKTMRAFHGITFKMALCAVLAIVCGASAVTFGYLTRDKRNTSGLSDLRETGLSDQEVYFYLRKEAHCDEDLNAMSKEELAKLHPYVEQLKTNKGPFYKLLWQEGWLSAYETLNK